MADRLRLNRLLPRSAACFGASLDPLCSRIARALTGDLIKAMMGTILAYITFAGAMGGAVYLLANDKPLYGLAALVTALGTAFGPKLYADFIQPRADQQSTA